MKPSVELFKLIKSLSKSEKRFFKLSSSLQSGDKNYLKLFDFIEDLETYDEELVKEMFKKEKFIKHLPSEKNHLYRLILKSLRSFYSEQSISSILKQEIKNVEILYMKALYKECDKFVVRAKQLAKETEKFYYWYELLSWEKKLLEEAYESGIFSKDLNDLMREEEEVISKLRNLAEYQVIYSRINLIFRSGGFTRTNEEREQVDAIANLPLIKEKNTAISVRASSMCYYIKGLCAATNREFDASYSFFEKTRQILDSNEGIKTDSGQRYVLTLSYLLRCHIERNEFKQAEQLIGDMRKLKELKGFNSTDMEVRIFTSSYNLELRLLHTMGKFQQSVQLIAEIESKQRYFGEKINKEQEILLTYNKAYSYFGLGEYKKALSYLNIVLNDNETKLRRDIYAFARLFNLVIHTEINSDDFIDYLIKSTNRYLGKHERAHKVENCVLFHFRKLLKTYTNTDRMLIYERLRDELLEIMKDPNEQVVMEYFDIISWVNSKVYKIPFDQSVVTMLKEKIQA
jgi:tetratricopeptide (TPR) repeat protein